MSTALAAPVIQHGLRRALLVSLAVAAIAAAVLAWDVTSDGWGTWPGWLLGAAVAAAVIPMGPVRGLIIIVLAGISVAALPDSVEQGYGVAFCGFYAVLHTGWVLLTGSVSGAIAVLERAAKR